MSHQFVEYPGQQLAHQSLVVEIPSRQRACELAAPILDLVIAGYRHHYEGPGKPLAHGAFAGKYDNYESRERWRDEVVPGVYDRDGGYYVVKDPEAPTQLAAVFKALPGAAAEERFRDRALGIAEIVVHPRWQGYGLAAATLLTHLEYGDLRPDDRGMSDVIDGSPMARWLWSLFFNKELPSGELRLDPQNALPSHYYVTEVDYLRDKDEEVNVASIAAEIKDRHPDLATSRVTSG